VHELNGSFGKGGTTHCARDHDCHLLVSVVREISHGYGRGNWVVIHGHVVVVGEGLVPEAWTVVQVTLLHLEATLVGVEHVVVLDFITFKVYGYFSAGVVHGDGF